MGWDPANDGDNTGLPVMTKAHQANRQRQFGQKVRLASTGENRIDYVLGDHFWQIIRGYRATTYGAAAANWNLPTVPAVVGNAALDGFEANSTSTPETKSLAAFEQATWNAITEQNANTVTFRQIRRQRRERAVARDRGRSRLEPDAPRLAHGLAQLHRCNLTGSTATRRRHPSG